MIARTITIGVAFALINALAMLPCGLVRAEAPVFSADQIEFFEKSIRPALIEYCYECHSSEVDEPEGGLLLDSRERILKGGDSGAAITLSDPLVGDPDKSLLLSAISYNDSDLAMPPEKKLPRAVIDAFRRWIKIGAPWPAETAPTIKQTGQFDWAELQKKHWAWQKVVRPEVPKVQDANWPANEIDRFVRVRLEQQQMKPSPPAEKQTLIRRAYLDMIGLPPTPARVEAFVSGKTPWNTVIEQLLASPHYGERWGRHWLDVARYSDGFGGSFDNPGGMPQAYRYRDWVIAAWNANMPYDQFVRLQIAGDLIDGGKQAVATGFFALGPNYQSDGGDPASVAMAKIETLDDRVDTLGRGLLGVTLACARCHDHKFDPIPTLDYYSIAGIFNNSNLREFPMVSDTEARAWDAKQRAMTEKGNDLNRHTAELHSQLTQRAVSELSKYMIAAREYAKLEGKKPLVADFGRSRGLIGSVLQRCAGYFARNTNDQKIAPLDGWYQTHSDEAAKEFQERIAAIRAERKKLNKETPDWNKIWRPLSGNLRPDGDVSKDFSPEENQQLAAMRTTFETLKKNMPPKFPTAHGLGEGGSGNMNVALRGDLRKKGPEAPRRFLRIIGGQQTALFANGSGRLELAAAVTVPDNPLTARVFVNRIWGWHFGQALVASRSNFGHLGQKPTHPKLLDWLAATFVESGWKIKDLHRMILRSKTYRMSSQYNEAMFAKDGDNKLLWRFSPRKIDVEAWRDSMLSVTGELNTAAGAPFDNLETDFRRTLYAKTSRNGDRFASDDFLRRFDFPIPRSSVAKRTQTITAQQSLFLLNNPFFLGRAKTLAGRLTSQAETTGQKINLAYSLLFSRNPMPEEIEAGTVYLNGKDPDGEKIQLSRLERYAQALLASSEFFFVE